MKDKIKEQHLKEIDQLYHKFMFYFLNNNKGFGGKAEGITQLEIAILNIINLNPDVVLRDILNQLKIPKSTLTSAINRLEKREVLKRKINSRDKRTFSLELTDIGIEIQKIHLDSEKKYFKDILNALDSNEERENFIKSANKIISKLRNI